jgi:ribosomal protein S18 acetylase RimI-like enzyme
MAGTLRMRRHLEGNVPSSASWPDGTRLAALSEVDPRALHAILADAYANGFGAVAAFAEWWASVETDEEFDPALVLVAVDPKGSPIGLALCWTSGFIKDLAVVPAWRGKGIGEALLQEVFAAFRARGLPQVDLKVVAANAPALGLYRRAGMAEVPL